VLLNILPILRVVLFLTAFGTYIFTGAGSHSVVIVCLFTFAYYGTFTIEEWLQHRESRKAIDSWRVLGPSEQEAGIARIWSASGRQWLRDALAGEGMVEQDGNVERFPFSKHDQEQSRRTFWFAVIAAGVCLVLALFVESLSAWWKYVIAALGVLLGLSAVHDLFRLRHLATVLEVSPFRVAIRYPAGKMRYLLLAGPLELEHKPKSGRLELRSTGATDFIPIDCERIGVARAIDLIVQYGGFKDQDGAT
jgi:hypothetical protein